jgi:hypothetical protein
MNTVVFSRARQMTHGCAVILRHNYLVKATACPVEAELAADDVLEKQISRAK